MGKPFRSPLLGYNHNLSHLGRVFHVQTEDSGPAQPRLFTHLFFQGTILASRKHEYDPALPEDRVRLMMQTQHKMVMRDLMQAKFDERIIPFFAARGEDIAPPGAVPAAPQLETPGPMPVMVLPPAELAGAVEPVDSPPTEPVPVAVAAADESATAEDSKAATPAKPAAPVEPAVPAVPTTPAREASGSVPVRVGPRRTSTRPIETSRRAGGNPAQVVMRPADARRPPFVRSGSGPVAKISSTDGVVVHRSVVVGDPAAAPSRPARIRPPVPYVVTGGGHTERPPRAESPAVTQPMPVPSAPIAAAPQPTPAPAAPSEPHRGATGAFGVGLADDKSLDEVILEYLSDDGD